MPQAPDTPGSGQANRALVLDASQNLVGGIGAFVAFQIQASLGGFYTNGPVALEEGSNIVAGVGTGTKIATSALQKVGFWNATPVVQQTLSTGAGATVDDVISLLQTLGLCKQS